MIVDIITIPLGFVQCYVLKGEGIVAVDSGAPGKGSLFARTLEAKGIRLQDLNLVILTHGHWDHIGSAAELTSLTGAPLALHKAEASWLENSIKPLSPGINTWGRILNMLQTPYLSFIKIPPSKVEIEIEDDGMPLEDYGLPGRVVHTPGHSSGSVSVVLDSGEAFVGDLAINKFPICVTPSLPIFADDQSALIDSWHKLIRLGVSKVYPAHGKPFPISVIEKQLSSID